MTLPSLDLLAHNLTALCVALGVLLLLSQLIVAAILRASDRLLKFSVLKEVTTADRATFRQRVRRRALVTTALLALALFVGAVLASSAGLRSLDLGKAAIERLRAEDLTFFKTRLLAAVGTALGALVADFVARGLASALGKGLSRSARLAASQELLAETVARLRTALRAVILCSAAMLIADELELSPETHHSILLGTYVIGAFCVSRLVTRIWYLWVEVFFAISGKLARLEGPLRHVGNLSHLDGVSKRAGEYFVYVGAATWVADQFTPDTWLSHVGQICLRVIVIFYTSRVLVELCSLFLKEVFLGKADEGNKGNIQQRMTLIPVAVGFVRYGIYFSALVMVLREASIDPTPLLAGAGVIGVAIGFGAQAFVGDIVAGFFILFENLLLVGDLVEVAGVRGKVEEIGVRITKIRDDAGVLHAIPNGEVRKVASHSKAYVNAVVDVHVPYEEDLHRVRALLRSVADKVVEKETGARAPVEVKVQELTEGSVLLRLIAQVPPGQDEDLGDELRACVVEALRAAGIGAPRVRKAVLLDGGIHVGSPPEVEKKEEEEKAPNPFEPKDAED